MILPLVRASSITDPKGDKMTYIYDDFNRLKEIRDKNNNILSENEYHYRTQN
jgi:YD repeat-containing protein